jgi:anti-sigma factor RsiW
MKHMTEEELIAFREGVAEQRAVISDHLAACEECRGEFERIEAVLAALDMLPVPEPGADYGRRVWREIAPRLAEKPVRWWQVWMQPRRLAAAGAVGADYRGVCRWADHQARQHR